MFILVLAVLGFSCGTWDLLLWWVSFSLVVAHRLGSCDAGLVARWQVRS